MFTIQLNQINELTPVLLAVVVSYTAFVFTLGYLIYHKYHKQPAFVSNRTKTLQKTLIMVVILQLALLFATTGIPIILVVINLDSLYLDIYFSAAILSASCFQMFECVMIILTIKPYRDYVVGLICFKSKKTVVFVSRETCRNKEGSQHHL